MHPDLTGQVVLVIGGSSGMGLATAELVRDHGAEVIIAARDPDRLERARSRIGTAARAVPLDVSVSAEVAACFEQVGPIDHVVTFAGALAFGRLARTPLGNLRPGMDVRVIGSAFVCGEVSRSPHHERVRSVTLCSGVASRRPRRGRSIGAAATASVEALARLMALELASVRVNVVCPGIIDTPMSDEHLGPRKTEVMEAAARLVPLGRVGEPRDVADAVLFLLGNAFVTGVTLVVDGGYVLGTPT